MGSITRFVVVGLILIAGLGIADTTITDQPLAAQNAQAIETVEVNMDWLFCVASTLPVLGVVVHWRMTR